MTVTGAHADAFFGEALAQRVVWTIRDAEGVAAAVNDDGRRAMPFWSSESRVRTLIATVPEYGSFDVQSIPLDVWRGRWLPDLDAEGMLVGLNWGGESAAGYDVPPADVLARFAAGELAPPVDQPQRRGGLRRRRG